MVAPTASYSDSDMFKDPAYKNKPKARRWDNHLSPEALSRQPPVLKQAIQHLGKPGLVSLGGGIPTPSNFPIHSLSFRVPSGAPGSGFSEADAAPPAGREIVVGKYDASVVATARGGSTSRQQVEESPYYDLSIALNYSQSVGAAQLLRWVTEHAELVSDPPYADWRCSLTIGSTGALEQAFRMLLCAGGRPGTGGEHVDSVITEEFSFATALETARPLGVRVYGVPMDGQGLIPEALDEILTGWDATARGGARKPHVLYTVPSGQNPTGATQGPQRRRDVYAVCQKHDVYIIEDEPYYFLHMPPYEGSRRAGREQQDQGQDQDIDAFAASLAPTYLSLDVDGRVMRMDSFSKIVVPGSRLGWITASQQIVEQYVRHAECASQGPSGISQLVLHKLVDETWGHDGFLRWLMHLAKEYSTRRGILLDACERELRVLKGRGDGAELVKWVVPKAPLVSCAQLWLEVNHAAHPDASTKSILQIEEEIYNACIANGVLVCRGSWFRAEPDVPLSGMFFRTTYAASSEENMVKGIERFGQAVRESFRI
ncbi:putative L-kynurenine/alpha-aminoadipate aminotransferase [Microdochium bolleyi]|uniref:Putative L-kynurenine/alpha-aminoadipate aminotransferase n=1 Tax=Microdochium bolleyi TaxID=196109 RepID=A0A136J2Z0_9PEZI|nr:putative L-kynurenine/alpha-aminoadipate aminotransferase [Microdochium bolleyi]